MVNIIEIYKFEMNEENEMEEKNFDARQLTVMSVQKSKDQKLEEIISERQVEEIQDDLTALRNQRYQSPLSFYLKIGNSYCFSFNLSKCAVSIGRFALFLPIFVVEIITVTLFSDIDEDLRKAFVAIFIIQLVLYSFLFLLDPGTLFEDEQQVYNKDRYLCQSCRLYRYPSTKHCHFCQKCVRGYDHHCSYFGKCIGRRNYIIFCCFILLSFFSGMAAIGSLGVTLVKSSLSK